MKEIFDLMVSTLQSNKENGSYFLFYILALGLGLAIFWDRYVQEEVQDNWMLEEAKKKIHLWPFLYGFLSVIIVAGNPFTIWILNKITPIEGQYYKIWTVLLLVFISAYGMVCFLSLLREEKQKKILILGFIILIALSGNVFGLMEERKGEEDYRGMRQVTDYLLQQEEEILVLGTPAAVEYLGVYAPEVKLLYGKDLYTPHLDMGIMDLYPDEFILLYEMVNNPEYNLEPLMEAADDYGCDYVILSYFEEAPEEAEGFKKAEVWENYILYGK